MSSIQKLTKKQRKALAFRDQKTKGKAKSKKNGMDLEADGLPIMEEQSEGNEGGDQMEMDQIRGEAKKHQSSENGSVEKKKGSLGDLAEEPKSKKRKRESPVETHTEGIEDSPRKKSKRVADDALGDGAMEDETGEGKMKSKDSGDHKGRYILFVGNLKYTTTIETITQHFASCDPPPTIRLLTPKATQGKQTTKSKGCAFLEFANRTALQRGLKLHHSELDGRVVNVELTAGGGGKGENRLKRLQERNLKLTSQRKTRQEKRKKTEGDDAKTVSSRTERYSSTSGSKQKPIAKKTWTVGDDDQSKSKRSKKRAKVSKPQGTGVNAIPIG